jgi:hypothetical protein
MTLELACAEEASETLVCVAGQQLVAKYQYQTLIQSGFNLGRHCGIDLVQVDAADFAADDASKLLEFESHRGTPFIGIVNLNRAYRR